MLGKNDENKNLIHEAPHDFNHSLKKEFETLNSRRNIMKCPYKPTSLSLISSRRYQNYDFLFGKRRNHKLENV